MKDQIGFYGVGNMGKAMIRGILQAKLYPPERIVVYEYSQEVLSWAEKVGIHTIKTPEELAEKCQVIVFSVKPAVLLPLLARIAPHVTTTQLLISVAAGVTLHSLEKLLSNQHKIIRAMPNTPALVGEAMSSVTGNAAVLSKDMEKALALFNSFGTAQPVPEQLIDAVVGVSGSAPAYVYMFIEALADGAVLAGMPRKQAYQFAAQTVLGSAKMVLDTGKHPGELKDMVTSPGGTTIEAVQSLEDNHFRSSVIRAVNVAAQKNKAMGEKK